MYSNRAALRDSRSCINVNISSKISAIGFASLSLPTVFAIWLAPALGLGISNLRNTHRLDAREARRTVARPRGVNGQYRTELPLIPQHAPLAPIHRPFRFRETNGEPFALLATGLSSIWACRSGAAAL